MMKTDFTFLLWGMNRNEWWKPGGMGYTSNVDEAGRFTREAALAEVVNASFSGRVESGVVMVAAPENWRRVRGDEV